MIPSERAREKIHRHGGRPHGEEQEQIVREDQIVREAEERERQDSEEREMLGVGERMRKGVKGIRLEETQGIVNHLVGDPGHRPRVQARVAVVEPREARGMEGERVAQHHRGDGVDQDCPSEIADRCGRRRDGGPGMRARNVGTHPPGGPVPRRGRPLLLDFPGHPGIESHREPWFKSGEALISIRPCAKKVRFTEGNDTFPHRAHRRTGGAR